MDVLEAEEGRRGFFPDLDGRKPAAEDLIYAPGRIDLFQGNKHFKKAPICHFQTGRPANVRAVCQLCAKNYLKALKLRVKNRKTKKVDVQSK
jgi:hypothetical protein